MDADQEKFAMEMVCRLLSKLVVPMILYYYIIHIIVWLLYLCVMSLLVIVISMKSHKGVNKYKIVLQVSFI